MWIIMVIGVIALEAVSVLWGGYALSVLWGWFMVPTFGFIPLTIPAAIGVMLVVSLLTHQSRSGTEKRSDAVAAVIAFNLLGPMVILIIGWIVKGFL